MIHLRKVRVCVTVVCLLLIALIGSGCNFQQPSVSDMPADPQDASDAPAKQPDNVETG